MRAIDRSGATGKMLKNRLRDQYGRHLLDKS